MSICSKVRNVPHSKSRAQALVMHKPISKDYKSCAAKHHGKFTYLHRNFVKFLAIRFVFPVLVVAFILTMFMFARSNSVEKSYLYG